MGLRRLVCECLAFKLSELALDRSYSDKESMDLHTNGQFLAARVCSDGWPREEKEGEVWGHANRD